MARQMRADAARNLRRVLEAGRDLVVEQGPDVPLDAVARRAGVGIATLYRRFPDRAALLKAVAREAFAGTLRAAHGATEQSSDSFTALATYLRDALELRVAAVIPPLLDVVDMTDHELESLRRQSVEAVDALVSGAHTAGTLRPDVTAADIGMMLVRIARPLPGPLTEELDRHLARRHLELFIRSLRADAIVAGPDLPGPQLAVASLTEMTEHH